MILRCFSKIAFFFLFGYLIVFLFGCRENVLINSKVSPSNDTIGVYQKVLPCITHTFFSDSVFTSTSYPGIPFYEGVGVLTDPFFGSLSCATFFQLIPAENGFTFAATDTIDSAILVLPYSGFTYGDSANQNIIQSYQVFYMTDSLGDISTASYYAFNTKSIDAAHPLSNAITLNTAHLIDSFLVTGKNHSGLRLRLNTNNLMNRLNPALNACSASGNPTEQLFISSFNGICVKPSDTRLKSTAMPYFQLDGADAFSEAGILVYYHANVGDTTYAQFYFNTSYCSHFNNIVNTYAHSPINNLYHSVAKNDDIVAISNLPGAGIDLKISGISSLPAGIINKAEIQLTLLPSYNNGVYISPAKIYATGIASATYPSGLSQGEIYNLADRYPLLSLTPYSVLDGYPHTNIGSNGYTTYTVNIPRELMQAIAQKSDTIHVQLNGTADFYGAYHLVAGGGNYPDSNFRAKFKVVYSQLNN